MSTIREPIITAHDLRRRFGAGEAVVDAVDGVALRVDRGRLTAIMGPSGSGKSTLLHLLAGLDRPTAGPVEIGGVALEGLSERELTRLRSDKLGFVFQAFNLLPVLDVQENVGLPEALARRNGDAERVEEVLEAVGLVHRRRHRPAELSGGEQQRVAIARALLGRPAVVFADEPTGNLDSAASADVTALLRRAVDELGQNVVMVTHDPDAAAVGRPPDSPA